MDKLFSVIIPVYNAKQSLDDCVASVQAQNFNDYEVILVDDGSTDGGSDLCDRYAKQDNRIKVIHKVNEGVVAARACGVDNALGQYVVFIDSDDSVRKDYLSLFAEKIVRTSADIVCCGAVWVKGGKLTEVKINAPFGYLDRNSIEQNIFPYLIEDKRGEYFSPAVWGKAFKKELFSKYMYRSQRVSIGEDNACVKPCVFHARSMYIIEDCLYIYKLTDGSLTRSKRIFESYGPREIGRHLENTIDMSVADMQDQVYRCVVHYLFNVIATQFNGLQNYRETKKKILDILNDDYYANAVAKCKYNPFSKGALALWALKHKKIILIKMYNGRVR